MRVDDSISRIDAQWFAEGEGEDENGLEVLFVQDGDPIEEKQPDENQEQAQKGRTLSDEEYAELVRKADGAAALAEPIAELVKKVAAPAQSPAVQQAGETDEEFMARMEQQAFIPGKFGETMRAVSERINAPVIGQMANIILNQARQIMRSDPERGATFRKYEQEIVEVAKTLPQTANVYEQAYEKVLLRKQPEILEEQRKADKEELKKEIMAELGIDPATVGQKQPTRKPIESLGQRSAAGGGAGQESGKQVIRLYESERDRMMAIGLDPKDPDAVAVYLKNHPRRK